MSIFPKKDFPDLLCWDNQIIEVSNSEFIRTHNSIVVLRANRQIYNYIDDFALAKNILKMNPNLSNPERPRLDQM
ncbi:hypothetical protein MARINOS108_11851 [Marinoscillum sp. 108]|nr:hypothetical protein MARINOS108_11851 [Marinoscillum sp. 108]